MSAADAYKLLISLNFSYHAILNIKGTDYHVFIRGINKSEAINLMQNINLTQEIEYYET